MVQKNLSPKDTLLIVDVQNEFCVGEKGRLNRQGSVAIATDLRAVALDARPYFHQHVSPALASASSETFGISIAFSADDQALSTEGALCR